MFIERLSRSLKHKDVYLEGYADGREAQAEKCSLIAIYNAKRPYQALATRITIAVWREGVTGACGGNDVDVRLSLEVTSASPVGYQHQERQISIVA